MITLIEKKHNRRSFLTIRAIFKIIKWLCFNFFCEVSLLAIRILSVFPGSPAARAGIQAGDALLRINGENVLDEIDYQALSSVSRLHLDVLDVSGQERAVAVTKKDWEPLGLCLDETTAMKPRHCRNHCLFCFIDQLPKHMRDTLYVKDDDWRLSLMMGNYVTLTNVSNTEFERMLKRHASPLYISVHATDPEVRIRLLRNPEAGNLMTRLRVLRDHGMKFHGQIVLCPGINDGNVLDRTIQDMADLMPAAQSLAIVPIGLTRHREHLTPMRLFTPESAAAVVDQVRPWQEKLLQETGTRFVFLSDEFYCLSGRPIPPEEDYEDYSQIENGVGMIRQLKEEASLAAEDPLFSPTKVEKRHLLIPTGVSVAPFIRQLAEQYAPPGTTVEVIPVVNRFFGETITVTGLIVGQDLMDALSGRPGDEVLIAETMLRENTDRFLDNVTLEEVRQSLGIPLRVVENNGESLIRALRNLKEE